MRQFIILAILCIALVGVTIVDGAGRSSPLTIYSEPGGVSSLFNLDGGTYTVPSGTLSIMGGPVGIGTTDPSGALNGGLVVQSNGPSAFPFEGVAFGNIGNDASLNLARANGSLTAMTGTQAGDGLGVIYFSGHDGVNYPYYGAAIEAVQDGPASPFLLPTKLNIITQDPNGTYHITTFGKTGILMTDSLEIVHRTPTAPITGYACFSNGQVVESAIPCL